MAPMPVHHSVSRFAVLGQSSFASEHSVAPSSVASEGHITRKYWNRGSARKRPPQVARKVPGMIAVNWLVLAVYSWPSV